MSHRTFSWPLRVYIEDTDAGGIVYYVNYLKFMERARSEWLRALGFRQSASQDNDFLFVVQQVDIRYLRSARLDDELMVTAAVERLGRASLRFKQQVLRTGVEQGAAEVLAEAQIKVACVSRAALLPCAMPDDIYTAVQAWFAGSDTKQGNQLGKE